MDRERRHVRLVDHEPDAAVGDDLAADDADEVRGQAVRLELLAIRLWRPRGRERGALDELDGGQVRDGHRTDDEDGRRHPADPRTGAVPVSSTPPPAGRSRTPRGSVTYSGARVARSSTS